MKQKTYCSFRFDRKKQVEARGYGNVEVQIRLSPNVRTYIKIKVCTPKEWRTFSKSKELKLIMAKYESIALSIITSGEVITKECLNAHFGREVKEEVEELNKCDSFLDFMCAGIATDQIEPRTKDHRMVALRNLEQFGKIKTFADLTPNNISKYDEWLRSDPSQPKRSDTTIKDYHKTIHRYVMRAFERGIIERDPYRSVTIKHGKNKERTPLVEEELLVLRNLHLTGKLEKNNFGSDKRELFTMKQAMETAFHDLLLPPLELVCEFNGWTGIVPTVPIIMLTTLDEHKDATRVNVSE